MQNGFERKNKRERKRVNYLRAAATGKIPWNAAGLDACVRHLGIAFVQLSPNAKADWNPYPVAMNFLRAHYSVNWARVHFLRMGAVINFMDSHKERLHRDKIAYKDSEGVSWWDDHLADALARLPFTVQGFRYEDVKGYVDRCNKPS